MLKIEGPNYLDLKVLYLWHHHTTVLWKSKQLNLQGLHDYNKKMAHI